MDENDLISGAVSGVVPNQEMRLKELAERMTDSPVYRALMMHSNPYMYRPQPPSGVPFQERMMGRRQSGNVEFAPQPQMTIEDIIKMKLMGE